ncbi:uncharacterized protein LOC141802550 [Halichoeres trimaculatus]|uniref:uncharacterized protein LOC141802550 n=1 Tax=Halichoeres trimaculatus TaxID=147232 RepID=UPI003D9E26F2
MVNYCRVLGCTNRSDREKHLKFFRLPKTIANQGEECKQLSEERRRLWLAKLHQDFRGKNLDNIRVCSQHFLSGTKAYLHRKDDPDWVPSLNMRQKPDPQFYKETLAARYKRRVSRAHRKVEADASQYEPVAADSSRREPVTDHKPRTGTQSENTDVRQTSVMKEEQQEWSSYLEQRETKPLLIKEEEEDDTNTLPFNVVTVKSEDEEEDSQSTQLHHRQAEQVKTGADEEDCGGSMLDIKVKIEESSEPETDDSDDWSETGSGSAGNINGSCHSCSQCGKAFKRKSFFIRHMRTHSREKPSRFSECGERDRRKKHSTTHVALHEEKKPFGCTKCGKRYKFEKCLANHLSLHKGEPL